MYTITVAMPYSINAHGSQTRDRSQVPRLEHNSFIIQSYFSYLRWGWECVKWGFFFFFFLRALIRMKGYIYTIPQPRRLLEGHCEGRWWWGGVGGFLYCRATLTHSRVPATNFIQCMCHPLLCSSGRVFIHLVKCVAVIMSSGVRMQSLCCIYLQNYSLWTTSTGFTNADISFMLIPLNWWFPFSSHSAEGREKCRHSSKLAQWMHHIFFPSPPTSFPKQRAKLFFITIYHLRHHVEPITSLLSFWFIHLFINFLTPPAQIEATPTVCWWNHMSISF